MTALLAALADPQVEVRWAAVKALGLLGDPRALEPLAWLHHDEDRSLRRAAREAWRKIQQQTEPPH